MVPTGRVTIRDVAKAAGVSVSTISKVMNNRDGISEATQHRVREVINQLGYVSSVSARSLRVHRTGVIGVLISDFEPYATEVLKGIAQECHGCPVELMAWSGGTVQDGSARGWEQRLIARLAGTVLDAAILVAPSMTSVPFDRFAMVAIDPHEGPGFIPSIRADDAGGARLAVDHLVSLGHRRIAFLGGRADLASAKAREQGFREAMAAHGLVVDEALVVRGDYSLEGATQPAHDLLSAPDPATAIFAANDLSALRVIEVARELGIDVPGQVSVVGFDDIPESLRSVPSLTTVAQPMIEIGRRAASVLFQLMARDEVAETDVRLPTRLVVRDSTAAPRRA